MITNSVLDRLGDVHTIDQLADFVVSVWNESHPQAETTPVEIERKWAVLDSQLFMKCYGTHWRHQIKRIGGNLYWSELPEWIHLLSGSLTRIVYLSTNPDCQIRIWGGTAYEYTNDGLISNDLSGFMTLKRGRGVTRTEYEIPFPQEYIDALCKNLPLPREIPIQKTRYVFKVDGCDQKFELFALDDNHNRGLFYLETEFDSQEAARGFVLPKSLLEQFKQGPDDVTNDPESTVASYWKRTRLGKKSAQDVIAYSGAEVCSSAIVRLAQYIAEHGDGPIANAGYGRFIKN